MTPTSTEPVYHLGDAVVANATPGHPVASVREGGPGRVYREARLSPRGMVWVQFEDGSVNPYLPCELKPQPTV